MTLSLERCNNCNRLEFLNKHHLCDNCNDELAEQYGLTFDKMVEFIEK